MAKFPQPNRSLTGVAKFSPRLGPEDPAPSTTDLNVLRAAVQQCKACDLWKNATQAVLGEGPRSATVMFVGEQPGDREDLAGHPFVGPAGLLFNRALEEAGLDRDEVFVTNVVKHFKWEPAERGKRRIHKKPRGSEITACRAWLDAELEAVRPEVLVCLGATAAQALMGKNFSVLRQRGQWVQSPIAPHMITTVHPSSLLRAPDDETRHREMARFVEDLRLVTRLIHSLQRRRAG